MKLPGGLHAEYLQPTEVCSLLITVTVFGEYLLRIFLVSKFIVFTTLFLNGLFMHYTIDGICTLLKVLCATWSKDIHEKLWFPKVYGISQFLANIFFCPEVLNISN
jgi:hypothetical protein